jgi:hypothetical protein
MRCITLKSFGNKSVILGHAYSSIVSLITDMKPEAKEKLTTAAMLFFILQTYFLNKKCAFFRCIYHTFF